MNDKQRLIDHKATYAIIGMGKSGQSVLRWMQFMGIDDVYAIDTRDQSLLPAELTDWVPQARLFCGDAIGRFEDAVGADKIDVWVVSPGLDLSQSPLVDLIPQSAQIWGDVELFARYLQDAALPMRCVGITGSNGKSTVTKMLTHMLNASGSSAQMAGNIGQPVLDLLHKSEQLPSVAVLELSSFQLETIEHLSLETATILNLSADHLDRHQTLEAYGQMKQRIFQNAKTAVVNRDDLQSCMLTPGGLPAIDFSLENAKSQYFYDADTHELVRFDEALVEATALPFEGVHNIANALAALALAEQLGFDPFTLAQTLKTYEPLAHRMSLVQTINGVRWINDSKATNVGATLAAVQSYEGGVHLILGGVSKGQDLAPLATSDVVKRCASIHLIGESTPEFQAHYDQTEAKESVYSHSSLEVAVSTIASMATSGDVALLSPACASFDMFENFEKRGLAFIQLVGDLALRGVPEPRGDYE